jgi:hypothetical protein
MPRTALFLSFLLFLLAGCAGEVRDDLPPPSSSPAVSEDGGASYVDWAIPYATRCADGSAPATVAGFPGVCPENAGKLMDALSEREMLRRRREK